MVATDHSVLEQGDLIASLPDDWHQSFAMSDDGGREEIRHMEPRLQKALAAYLDYHFPQAQPRFPLNTVSSYGRIRRPTEKVRENLALPTTTGSGASQ